MLRRALFSSLVLHLLVMLGFQATDIFVCSSPPGARRLDSVLAASGRDGALIGKPAMAGAERDKPAAIRNETAVLDIRDHRPGVHVASPLPFMPVSGSAAASHGVPASSPFPGEADGLRQYRLALAREARPYKQYPQLAREQVWEGVVLIQVSQGGAGEAGVQLLSSSGHEILDAQALETVTLAVRRASLPESLQGRAFDLSLPIHYSLGD